MNLKVIQPFLIIVLAVITVSCGRSKDEEAINIMNQTIERAGGEVTANAKINFKFRDHYYSATRQSGRYSLEKCENPSCSGTRDVITNDGFKRYVKGKEIKLPDSLKTKYGNSVNSVHYFAMLPFGLDASSVHKEMVGESQIKGEWYYKVKVTFDENGGGDDFQDEYMYWINKTNYTIDYLAYNYEVNEGGTRFRE
ncbi:MAG: DUF6503 family protein, partial [Leeuwenhoekiella sp.]